MIAIIKYSVEINIISKTSVASCQFDCNNRPNQRATVEFHIGISVLRNFRTSGQCIRRNQLCTQYARLVFVTIWFKTNNANNLGERTADDQIRMLWEYFVQSRDFQKGEWSTTEKSAYLFKFSSNFFEFMFLC